MKQTLINIAALLLGLVVGSAINMALILTGAKLIAPPAGVNVADAESIAAGIDLFEPKHFIFPFIAHALGTLVGALVTYLVAASHKSRLAVAIGILFLCGGIANIYLIPAPAWFVLSDIMFAYLPMAWVAIQLGLRFQDSHQPPD